MPSGSTASLETVQAGGVAISARLIGWAILAVLAVFLVNNYLTFWQGWPGAAASLEKSATLPLVGWLQTFAYPVAVAVAFAYVFSTRELDLRSDGERVSQINTFFIRAAFWAVLYVGIADMVISFLRVEGLLFLLFGDDIAASLGRSQYRGPMIHLPLIGLAVVTATMTRTLGFYWLTLLIVVAELLIVIARFIFSYEQAFMADLVRFWYAALFLFASAYTLIEEGHVRVDVFYAGFASRTKGIVNAVGSLVLGITFCWVILVIGMGTKSSIINSPILSFETTQAGYGMYVKYLMAGFLGVFAISMMIQFVSTMMNAVADIRGDPGGRNHDVHAIS